MNSQFKFFLKSGGVASFDADHNQLHISPSIGEPRVATLSYSESRLLQLLLDCAGETRSRNEIMEFAWDNRVVAAGSLNQAIFTLRNLIDDGADHELLQTIPRRGYRFNARYLAEPGVQAATPERVDAPAETAAQPETPPREGAATGLGPRLTGWWQSPTTLWAAYGLMACVLALVLSYRLGVFDRVASELVREDRVEGPLTYHFIGDSQEEIARTREFFQPALASRDLGPGGHVWINRSNRLYDLSCVSADGSTRNLIFLEDNPMANLPQEMIRRCLGDHP